MKLYHHIDQKFNEEKLNRFKKCRGDKKINEFSYNITQKTAELNYTYNFEWLGVPIIQYPDDMILTQEIIYKINPDLIIETGIARAGSMIFYASLLQLIGKKNSKVVGIDIDIREHAHHVYKNHFLKKRLKFIEGSSIDEKIFKKVLKYSKKFKKILVILDSAHTHNHVLKELELYSKLVSHNSHLLVFDTTIHKFNPVRLKKIKRTMPNSDTKSNPYTAIKSFLKINKKFKLLEKYNSRVFATNLWNGVLIKYKNRN
jgi:cephalosporin hydroxylase